MMLLAPWYLLVLFPVAAVAVFTLFRPARRIVSVSSLRLWREALEAISHRTTSNARRMDASWLLLLAGIVAAVIALCRPVYHSPHPARHIAIEAGLSAEIATEKGMSDFKIAAKTILRRLSPEDRVLVVLPVSTGGGDETLLTPTEAAAKIEALSPLPVKGSRLRFPAVRLDVQHVYRLVSAGTVQSVTEGRTEVEIATDLPLVTLDSFAAVSAGEGVEILATLQLSRRDKRPKTIVVDFIPVNGYSKEKGINTGKTISRKVSFSKTGDLASADCRLPVGPVIAIVVRGDSGKPILRSWLVLRQRKRVPVAITGRDEPLLRRYIESDPMLLLVADDNEAEIIIANGINPPARKPSLSIRPPVAPKGWLEGNTRNNIVIGDADIMSNDPVLRDVVPGNMAVRTARLWKVGESPSGRILVRLDGEALILRTDPGTDAIEGGLRRVYFAFDLSAENTNMVAGESFVILMANIFRWLSPENGKLIEYDLVNPSEAVGCKKWQRLQQGMSSEYDSAGSSMPCPGLYRDDTGEFHAVDILGLSSFQGKVSSQDAAESAPLPDPIRREGGFLFWPFLAAAAILLWLASWILRNSAMKT